MLPLAASRRHSFESVRPKQNIAWMFGHAHGCHRTAADIWNFKNICSIQCTSIQSFIKYKKKRKTILAQNLARERHALVNLAYVCLVLAYFACHTVCNTHSNFDIIRFDFAAGLPLPLFGLSEALSSHRLELYFRVGLNILVVSLRAVDRLLSSASVWGFRFAEAKSWTYQSGESGRYIGCIRNADDDPKNR